MRLSQLFTGQVHTEGTKESGETQSARASEVSKLIRSLVNGQTIQGEVVSKSGTDIQLKLIDDLLLNAKLEHNMNMETGQIMTFEVRNNGRVLSLSPLFTNVSTDVNVLKALDMAGLPVNEASVEMTEKMMQGGLSIDKNSLQQVYREVTRYMNDDLNNIIDLHRMNMPVNENNLEQIVIYKNNTYQLSQGIDTFVETLPETVTQLISEKNAPILNELTEQLVAMLENVPSEEPDLSSTASGAASQENEFNVGKEMNQNVTVQPSGQEQSEPLPQLVVSITETDQNAFENTTQMGSNLPEELKAQVKATLGLSEEQLTVRDLLKAFNAAFNEIAGNDKLEKLVQQLFDNENFRETFKEALLEKMLLKPEDVADKEKVDKFYQKLSEQFKNVTKLMEASQQTQSATYKAADTIRENVQFLNDLNHMFTYVQLPLKLQNGQNNGDLYVYTNKKNLADSRERVTALLHLDMEHLGPVDVYVAMQQGKVNTNFRVQDDSVLDLIESHIDLLNARLQKRGFDCNIHISTSALTEEDNGEANPIAHLLHSEKGNLISHYAFDVRT